MTRHCFLIPAINSTTRIKSLKTKFDYRLHHGKSMGAEGRRIRNFQ